MQELNGWNNVVSRALDGSELEQVDERTVRLTLGPFEDYDLKTSETLVLQIPSVALLSGRDVEVPEDIEVRSTPGTAKLSGFVDYDSRERAVRSGRSARWDVDANALLSEPMRLSVKLSDDEWAPAVGQEGEVSELLLASLLSLQSEPNGWVSPQGLKP